MTTYTITANADLAPVLQDVAGDGADDDTLAGADAILTIRGLLRSV